MTSRSLKVIFKFQNNVFLRYFFCLKHNLIKTILECQQHEDKKFHKMKYDLKGHPRSYKITFMPKSFLHIRLWTDFDANLYEC